MPSETLLGFGRQAGYGCTSRSENKRGAGKVCNKMGKVTVTVRAMLRLRLRDCKVVSGGRACEWRKRHAETLSLVRRDVAPSGQRRSAGSGKGCSCAQVQRGA